MNRAFKIIILFLLMVMMLMNFVYAEESKFIIANNDEVHFGDGNISESDIDYYKPTPPQNTDYDDVVKKVGSVLGVIRVIGIIVSVAVLMVLGIKFMMGSVEEKAEYKRAFIPYLIGAAILFTGTTLPSIIYDWSHKALM